MNSSITQATHKGTIKIARFSRIESPDPNSYGAGSMGN